MTNERAYNIISEYCFTGYKDNKKPSAELFSAIRELVCEVSENGELRDYIKKMEKHEKFLKVDVETLSEINKNLVKNNEKQKQEIKKLEKDIFVLQKQYTNVENSNIRYYNEIKKLEKENKGE